MKLLIDLLEYDLDLHGNIIVPDCPNGEDMSWEECLECTYHLHHDDDAVLCGWLQYHQDTLSEEEIDEIVTAEADDDSMWEDPVYVHPRGKHQTLYTGEVFDTSIDLRTQVGYMCYEDILARMVHGEEEYTRKYGVTSQELAEDENLLARIGEQFWAALLIGWDEVMDDTIHMILRERSARREEHPGGAECT